MLWLWAKIQAYAWFIVAAVVIAALLFFLGYSRGSASVQHDWDEAKSEANRKALKDSEKLAGKFDEIDKIGDMEKDAIRAKYESAIASLRNRRAERLPVAAAAACEGTSGRELSGIDAEFLTRYAADAANAAEQARQCFAREDALREAMKASGVK